MKSNYDKQLNKSPLSSIMNVKMVAKQRDTHLQKQKQKQHFLLNVSNYSIFAMVVDVINFIWIRFRRQIVRTVQIQLLTEEHNEF